MAGALWAACILEAYSLFGMAGAVSAGALAVGGLALVVRVYSNRKRRIRL